MSGNAQNRFLRVSLRELLLSLGFIAVACAALKFAGGIWWTVLSSAALLGFLAAAVVAVVDRGRGQSFALGFVVCAGLYGIVFALAPTTGSPGGRNPELNLSQGTYPTTKTLGLLFDSIESVTWFDPVTGKEIRNDDPEQVAAFFRNARGVDRSVFTRSRRSVHVERRVFPDQSDFAAIGHLLWALLLGYIGGRFGGFLYHRRVSRDTADSSRPTSHVR